jgi:hypothetical protein
MPLNKSINVARKEYCDSQKSSMPGWLKFELNRINLKT